MTDENKEMQVLVLAPTLLSALEIADEEGFTKKQLKEAKADNFTERIKAQYGNIYRIARDNFEFTTSWAETADLELLAEFDNVSGELTKFNGWLESKAEEKAKDNTVSYPYINRSYAEVNLVPVKNNEGLIYHFKGTLEWTCTRFDWKGRTIPLSVIPVYGAPSGKIIALKSTSGKLGHSQMLDNAKIEYRSFDIKIGDE